MWSTHSRRIDPISRSTKPFCQGEAIEQASVENRRVSGLHSIQNAGLRCQLWGPTPDVPTTTRLNPKRTYSALSVATAGVLKIAISPLFRLPAVSCTKLRGRHEGAEAGVHRFVAPLA